MIRQPLAEALSESLRQAVADGAFALAGIPELKLESPRNPAHGDLATNVAMMLAKPTRLAPKVIAEAIVARLKHPMIAKAEVAMPGFINITLSVSWLRSVLGIVHRQDADYGRLPLGAGQTVQVEYVSANPTGPLSVGHGRNAALGSAISNLLRFAGYGVTEEFYINDFGNQLTLLGISVLLRAMQHEGADVPLPSNAYRGAFIHDLATDPDTQKALQEAGVAAYAASHADSLRTALAPYLKEDLPGDPAVIADLFAGAGDLITVATEVARATFLKQQQAVLGRFGCHFTEWFSERTLHAAGAVTAAIGQLAEQGYVFEAEGATWFKSTAFGDDKDRVLIRKDGRPTYIAGDIAYHLTKYAKGYDRMVNVWGADHHGDVARLKGAMQALGKDPAKLEVILYQLVNLYRDGQPVRMSKRTGELVTLTELMDEVGVDAARYFLIQRDADSPVDFDIDLAKKEASDNPVFYVQYAHARICSIERLAASQFKMAPTDSANLDLLTDDSERQLLLRLAHFEDEILDAASLFKPYYLLRYAEALATDFHSFYTRCRVMDPANPELSLARLQLASGVRIVLHNLLVAIVGVTAPTAMEKREEAVAG